MTVIGLDIGHSAVKVVGVADLRRKAMIFPSVISGAIRISDDGERRASEQDTVTINNVSYFTGDTARIQGGANVVMGLADGWVSSPQHEVLLVSALERMRREGFELDKSGLLVVGLPSSLYDQQKEALRQVCAKHTEAEVKVLRQPMGAYHATMFNEYGILNQGRSMKDDSFGLVDVGYYTTDFTLVVNGRQAERAAASIDGMRKVSEALQKELYSEGYHVDLQECEEILRTRRLVNFGQVVDATPFVVRASKFMIDAILDNANRLLGADARRLNGVIVAGGGADFVVRDLQTQWPHAIKALDSRMAIADGYSRFGMALMKAHRQSVAVAA